MTTPTTHHDLSSINAATARGDREYSNLNAHTDELDAEQVELGQQIAHALLTDAPCGHLLDRWTELVAASATLDAKRQALSAALNIIGLHRTTLLTDPIVEQAAEERAAITSPGSFAARYGIPPSPIYVDRDGNQYRDGIRLTA